MRNCPCLGVATRISLAALTGASILVGIVAPAFAGSSPPALPSPSDSSKLVTLTGVVQKIDWTEPQPHVFLDVTDSKGHVSHWYLEFRSPYDVLREGIKPGARIKVRTHPVEVPAEAAAAP